MTHRCLFKNPKRENRLVAREGFEPTTKGLWACQLPAAGARLYHLKDKWRGRDLNPRPRAYESPALPLSYLAFSGERYLTICPLICQYWWLNL